MIARKTCFDKFCLLSILFISIQAGRLFCFADEQCKGECKPLFDCNYFADRTFIDYNTLPYCEKENFVVCCPKPKTHTVGSVDYSKPYIADCDKWRKQNYEKCPEQSLIVDGDNATAKEFPHMALIGTQTEGKMDWFCGGALVSPKFVITADHCIVDILIPITVRLGELDYSKTDDDANIQDFKVAKFHFYLNTSIDKNTDIALLELNGTVEINSYVVPICLPLTNGSEFSRLYSAGWGTLGQAKNKSSLLQKIILERFDDKRCKTSSGSKDPRTQICFGSARDHRDTCNGDSGGPLFIESKIFACMYEIQGLVSEGVGCGVINSPSVYTRVLYFVDWIQSIVWNTTVPNRKK